MFGFFKRSQEKSQEQKTAQPNPLPTSTDNSDKLPTPTSKPDAVQNARVESAVAIMPAVTEAAVAPLPKVPPTSPLLLSSTLTQTQPITEKKGLFARLKAGLSRTRFGLTDGLASLLLGKKVIDADLLEELENQLLATDVGFNATEQIIQALTAQVSRNELNDSDALYDALKAKLAALLAPCERPLQLPERNTGSEEPFVILVVGVNGAGKTTTIGKLAQSFQLQGRSVMLAAGDTFRAAAIEQLQIWGDRHQVPVIAQHTGADSASVIFDGLQAARNRGVDILIADTAGRLHNKAHLMQELEKVVRVMKKSCAKAPHEVLLVLDAGTGQNALNQARQFQQAVGVSGLVLTKLDGTAKGGIIFAIAQELQLPVRFIGVGERSEDLRVFSAQPFIEALFELEDTTDS